METADRAFQLVTGKLQAWLEQAIALLPNLIVAVLVVVAFGLVAGWTRKLSRKALERTMKNRSVARLLARIAGIAVLVAGIVIALGVLQLEKTVTSLLAGAGVIGLALAFAFQDVAANLMSGIYLSVKQPFAVGDLVETNGAFGTVRGIDLRNTEIEAPDGKLYLLPNRKVFEELLTNYSRLGRRRVDVEVGVSYADDLEQVAEVTREALAGVEGRETSRDVQVFFTGFGGSSIDLVGRFWIPFDRNADFHAARSEGIRRIKRAYDAAGISIPFPIRTLDFGIEGGSTLAEMIPGTRVGTGNGERPAAS